MNFNKNRIPLLHRLVGLNVVKDHRVAIFIGIIIRIYKKGRLAQLTERLRTSAPVNTHWLNRTMRLWG